MPASLVALRVVEVRGHRDDGAVHRLAEVVFRRLLHLLQDHRRDLGRAVPLAAYLDRREAVLAFHDLVGDLLDLLLDLVHPAAHEALDREDSVLGVGHGLALRHLADQALTVLGEGHHGRGRPATLGVGNHDGVPALHDGDHRIGGAQVDADDFRRHVHSSLGNALLRLPFWRTGGVMERAGASPIPRIAAILAVRFPVDLGGRNDA